MGSCLTEAASQQSDLLYTEFFEEVFPWYLSLGMTPEQFWSGPPQLAAAYRKAYEFRIRRTNQESWRMGLYMVSALQASVGNMFLKKGATPIQYVNEPFPLTQEEVGERELKRAEEFEDRLKLEMMRWAAETQKK